jgi:CheY-like chemotaxis protein
MAKVLIVDDEDEVRSLFVEALREEGHDVQHAENGEKGIALSKIFSPDVIVLDVFMPEKDGVETLHELRSTGSQARIIACSGGGMSKNYDFLELTETFGADLVLKKPILPDQLVQHVRHCISLGPEV